MAESNFIEAVKLWRKATEKVPSETYFERIRIDRVGTNHDFIRCWTSPIYNIRKYLFLSKGQEEGFEEVYFFQSAEVP